MMRYLLFIGVTIFAFLTSAYAEIIKSGSLQASSDGANVTLRWITDDESGIRRFDIQRRSGVDGGFSTITSLDPKGPSLYEFVDYSAFLKVTTLYQYQVVVYFNDQSRPPQIFGPLTVSHTVSGVRRTWGSIKSMFR